MTTSANSVHLRALGRRILSEANDLKRTPAALARELGIEQAGLEAVIDGRGDRAAAMAVIEAMAEQYPVSIADLWIEPDDTDEGVRLMSAADSEASSRVFDRRDSGGGLSPYYEYRDTAMSAAAPFKPEWIAELRLVDDADPENPDVAYNNGHLLHQTTFFIGPVNFYWRAGGRSHCAELNTGDSNYITPFVPHSFTSRDPDRRGLIVAVTYAGEVRRAAADIGRIGADVAADLSGDLRHGTAFGQRLRRHLEAECLEPVAFADRLALAGIHDNRLAALLDGAEPSHEEIVYMAAILNIRPKDLMISPLASGEEVVVRRHAGTHPRSFPDDHPTYQLTELARSRHQPLLKGFGVSVLNGAGADLTCGLHEYIYNYGATPVDLVWNDARRETLGPGDSAYIQPMVPHRFEGHGEGLPGELAMIRVPGRLTDAVLEEFAGFEAEGRKRVGDETKCWF